MSVNASASLSIPTEGTGALPCRVQLPPDLLRFHRNGELLLVDGAAMQPLLVREGAAEIEHVLARVEETRDVAVLLAGGIEPELLDMLLVHGIVMREGRPRPVADHPRASSRPRPSGMSLYLLLAQDCNLGCIYCLNGENTYHRSAAPRMSREVAFRAVDMCFECVAPEGEVEIVFFGGEPLLNWPLAEEVIAYCETEIPERYPDRRCRFHLTSNLAKLPPGLADSLLEHHVTVLCDVDGPPDLHDQTRPLRGGGPSCERIAANIRTLLDAGLKVGLRATITSRNVDRMVDIARYHKELGGMSCSVVAVNAVNSDENILPLEMLPDPEKFARGLLDIRDCGLWEPKDIFPFNQVATCVRPGIRQSIPCGAAFGNTPVVDVNGDVYACIYLVGMSAYRIGSVFEPDSFPDVEVVQRMLDTVHVDNLEHCRDCAYRYVCSGGCAVGPLSIAANPDADEAVRTYQRESRCRAVQTVVESILWDYAERASDTLSREQPASAC